VLLLPMTVLLLLALSMSEPICHLRQMMLLMGKGKVCRQEQENSKAHQYMVSQMLDSIKRSILELLLRLTQLRTSYIPQQRTHTLMLTKERGQRQRFKNQEWGRRKT